MELRSLESLQRVDERAQQMTPYGLGVGVMLGEADTVHAHQQAIARFDLVDEVPEATRAAFERARLTYSYGCLEYDLFTVAEDLTRFVLELALRERFVYWAGGSIELTKDGPIEAVTVSSFDDVSTALSPRSRYRKQNWKLVLPGQEPVQFTGSLRSLMAWARDIGLLRGQRSRVHEESVIWFRNAAAHPGSHRLSMPTHASRAIRAMAELINQLYGVPTPGGHVYPAPVQRSPVFYCSDPVGQSITRLRPDQLRERVGQLGGASVTCFQVAHEEPEPLRCDSWFDATVLPATYLWGPGSAPEAAAWADVHAPEDDAADSLDRLFTVGPTPAGGVWAMRPEVVAALRPDQRPSHWYLVKADNPWDASALARNLTSPDSTSDPEAVASLLKQGTWTEVLGELQRTGWAPATASVPNHVTVDPLSPFIDRPEPP
jgi:hypothetical protein